ncbi:MAG: ADP-ribosylglycohydrolase family protein [Phycisphaerae bacterium]|nr:ADP-ribosylglycohydrolase family protein [Phycisphaerae bacterium]
MYAIEFPPLPYLREIVTWELVQRAEEGCAIGDLRDRLEATGADRAALLDVYTRLSTLAPPGAIEHAEPSNLQQIRAACPGNSHAHKTLAIEIDAGIADRILGGWQGRCAGLVLGKPLEHGPFMRDRRVLKKYLEAAGAYPLTDYAPGDAHAARQVGITPLPFPLSQRGNVRFVESDDDIRYTVMGLDILEKCGANFTTADVAAWWMRRMPAATLFTAEEAVYRNLILLRRQYAADEVSADELRQVTLWMNPYREWIGAQIRADGWALACPGQPDRAAEFAYRDASLSHVKNGIYGEMYCAAMIATAAVCDNPQEVVAAGLERIPERSRLAEAIRATVDRCGQVGFDVGEFETVLDWLWTHFGNYCPVHTINNAAAVTAAILLGGQDFEKAITIAVMAGWDADCNGATAGCVAGTMLGAGRLPDKWIAPLNDTLLSEIPGYHPIAISECARRQVEVAKRLQSE